MYLKVSFIVEGMKKSIQLLVSTFLLIALVALTLFYLPLSPEERNALLPISYQEPSLSPDQVYYLSPNGNDANSGTLGSPWKNLERALQPGAVPDSSTIYFLGGEHRINSGAIKDALIARGGLKGNQDNYFTIASFPGQRATLLLSERAPNTWLPYPNTNGKAIYFINWKSYVDSKSDAQWLTATAYPNYRSIYWNPQGVFVHGTNPLSLRMVNSTLTKFAGKAAFSSPISVRANQTNMIPEIITLKLILANQIMEDYLFGFQTIPIPTLNKLKLQLTNNCN